MKTITLVLTEQEAQELSTVLNTQLGNLQYRASQTLERTHLDNSWAFWHRITNNLKHGLGMTWLLPSQLSNDLLDKPSK